MSSLPLFLNLERGRIVLVGSSARARSKLAILRSLGADISWFPISFVKPEDVPEGKGAIEILDGEPRGEQMQGALAIVAAHSKELEERVAASAGRLSIPVNIVDRPDLSTFSFPAIVARGDVVVAIGTGGTAPVLARRLRERIEAMLPARLGNVATFLSRWRDRLKQFGYGRPAWEDALDGPIFQHLLDGDEFEAEAQMRALLAGGKGTSTRREGSVALVGAGPGDPDLLTLKALRALQDADIIFFDDLVGPEILDRARRDAIKVFVGKRKDRPGENQDVINRRMIVAARSGLRVVRLKGGDPFIFGRGGEELEALARAGVSVTVVPGITAALGCAADARLPLTFRGEARRVLIIAAHNAGGEPVDWSGAADRHTTVVVYMGLSAAGEVRDALIAAGRSPSTPAAVLARGTLGDSSVAVGTLADLSLLAARVGAGPAVLVIGEAMAHSPLFAQSRAADLALVA
ncbi:MAG TPA: siroheme synthase CysG [Rhizomicrobium sp.]|jgi:uroporphyrin-III C-methyltransferase/precorrin-2 dehydrogenase/sirohydrochlorin ferrochelatase